MPLVKTQATNLNALKVLKALHSPTMSNFLTTYVVKCVLWRSNGSTKQDFFWQHLWRRTCALPSGMWDRGGTAPLNVNLGTRWLVSFMLQPPLPPMTIRTMGGPQPEWAIQKRKTFCPSGVKLGLVGCSVRILIAVTTDQSRFPNKNCSWVWPIT